MATTKQINNNTVWEETDLIKIHNYPPNPNTFSYITRTYREYKTDKGWREIDGEPIYFNDLPQEQLALAIIMGTAQNALNIICKRSKIFSK